jgi:hypothetical protein
MVKHAARVVPLYDTDPAAHRIVRGSGSHTIIRTLDDRTLVLVFSLASPASSDTIQKILSRLAQDHVTPGMKVFAVSSFAANIGVDTPTPQLFEALKAFRTTAAAETPHSHRPRPPAPTLRRRHLARRDPLRRQGPHPLAQHPLRLRRQHPPDGPRSREAPCLSIFLRIQTDLRGALGGDGMMMPS